MNPILFIENTVNIYRINIGINPGLSWEMLQNGLIDYIDLNISCYKDDIFTEILSLDIIGLIMNMIDIWIYLIDQML